MFEEIGVFYRGLVLGLMIAAPVGPIGLLCIRRTLQKGLFFGLVTGLGAALADTLFSAVAALGVSAILDFMKHYAILIRLGGGLFLLFIAWHTWHERPRTPNDPVGLVKKILGLAPEYSFMGLVKAFLSGLAITLTNPATIFGILALVAGFGNLQKRFDAAILIAGIFAGSTLWWMILSGGITLVRNHFTEGRIQTINRITAVILAAIAFWAIISGLQALI